MTEGDYVDRKIPALLDRLVDYGAGSSGRLRRSPSGPPATTRDVCTLVLADLRTLLATQSLAPDSPVYEFELASRSVINYGIPDHIGSTLDAPIAERVRSCIRRAVEAFEPRVVSGTLRVELRVERPVSDAPIGTPNALSIEVSAQACPLPMPEQILLRTILQADGSLGVLGEERRE